MSSTQKNAVWEPCNTSETNVAKFMAYVNTKHNQNLKTYEDLHRWSVGDGSFQHFWQDAYAWLQIAPPGQPSSIGNILNKIDAACGLLFPPPLFFPNEKMNIAEFLLRNGKDDKVAIHFAREGGLGIEKVTWKCLRARVQAARDAMINSDVKPGDVIAAVISNSVDAIVLCLATLSIGAVWSSSSPDMGPEAIIDRYKQVKPKIIFADDGYVYAGKAIKLADRIQAWSKTLVQKSTELKHIVIMPYCNFSMSAHAVRRGCTYKSFLERGTGEKLRFKMLPFSHPAFILYSSGTTGQPKCIVHSAGGVALKVKTDMVLQHDIREDDVVFQYTTTSWIMWVLNFVNISSGASMLLYDGSPFYPRPTILLELAAEVKVSIFGTSPRYLSELKSRDIAPRKSFNLSQLRVMTSTGSVLSADLYDWFYNVAFPPRAQLISMSGGTDIAGCFVGGTPLLPIYAGEIQAKALGMAVDILDSGTTEPVSVEASGQPGELICAKPFPSQPLEFRGPGGQEKYRASYFDRFGPSVWCQGDFIQRFQDTGGLVMLGRSDGVLNPSGVRFGSAEIYNVVETFPAVSDSICIGQKRDCDVDERVLLFMKMKPGEKLTRELERGVRVAIKNRYTPRHVPRFIFEVADIPYTVNGKKCEINVKHVVCGRNATISATVANPEALDLYRQFQDLPPDETRSKL